jgi:HD-like signal output (HDOD) protein
LTVTKAPFGLDEWLAELSHMDAVAMGAVISQLNRLTASEESSVHQLVEEISKDPGLTTKVIKVANSVLYNPSRVPCNTISRAIMHVGFDTIRAICVSSMVIENLLKDYPREALIKQMARSFHAAVQARNLVQKARMEVKEEIFVATLLLHIGELLIWAYPHPATDQAYQRYLLGAEAQELEGILGVRFERLTQEIAKEWNLGETLNESLSPSEVPGSMAQAVLLGDEIAIALEQGMDSQAMQEVLKKTAAFTNKKAADLKKAFLASSDEAAKLSRIYGDPKITQLIREARENCDDPKHDTVFTEPDPLYQLEALQALMQMMGKQVQPAQLFQQVLKGLHQGVGLERVALAIFNASRTQISAKYMLGDKTVNWREKFRFAYERHNENLFAVIMTTQQSVWVGAPGTEKMMKLRSQAFDEAVGLGEFLLGPVIANHRQVGFIYADMRVSGRPLSENYFSGFKHFVQQTSLCLGFLAKK